MREAVLGLAGRHQWVRSLINPRQSTAIGFPNSTLNVMADEQRFATGPRPGENLPDAPVSSARGTHLSSLLGQHFTLLVFAPDARYLERAAELNAIAESLPGVPIRTLVVVAASTPTGEWERVVNSLGTAAVRFDAMLGAVYLVRPDGHLLGRWRAPDRAAAINAVRHCLAGGHP